MREIFILPRLILSMQKLWVISAVLLTALLCFGCIGPPAIDSNSPVKISPGNGFVPSEGSIILKVPIIQADSSGLNKTIIDYNNVAVNVGNEVTLNPKYLPNGDCASIIVFRLDGIDNNSISISVVATQSMDGSMFYQMDSAPQIISDGNCIYVDPMCTDVSVQYCFELKRDQNKILDLYYSTSMYGMPV